MHRRFVETFFPLLAICGSLAAQIELPDPLRGTYTVDPKGTGKRAFRDLETAVRYISLVGVSGDFELQVHPGEYKGALLFFPVPGLKEGERVVIRKVGQGEAKLSAMTTLVKFNEGCRDIVLDGFVFGSTGGASPTIDAGANVTDIEIRNCRFTEETGGSKVIEIQGKNNSRRWNIHHNVFEFGNNVQQGIYTQSTYQLNIHHNEFVCDQTREPVSIWNANKSESRVADNLFRGTVQDRCIRLDVSGHDVDVFNNLFVVELRNANDALIRSQGLRNTAYNKIRHNVFIVKSQGTAVMTRGPFAIDHNLYAIEEGGVGMTNNAVQQTLKDWQDAIAEFAVDEEADQHSAVARPKFFDRHAALIRMFHDFDVEDGEGGSEGRPRLPSQSDPKDELRYLVGLLRDEDPVVLRLALRGLERYGRQAMPAVPALGKLCSHEHAAVRADAAEALGRIRIGAEIVIPELIKMLGDKDERVLVATANTLAGFAHLAAEAAPVLESLEKNENETIAKAAAAARKAVLGKTLEKK